MVEQIDAGAKAGGAPQRLIEVAADEMWTPFLEKINDLFLQEKKARQASDHNRLAEICTQVVSSKTSSHDLTKNKNMVVADTNNWLLFFF